MRTVLFADDDATILCTVQQLFSNDPGIKLLAVSSGKEVLNIIRNEDVWLVVADNRLPDLTGIELLKQVRNISPMTGRILMSGHADLKIAIDAINICEAFRFIMKPWDDDELKTIIYEGLERSAVVRELAHSEQSAISSIAQTIELKDPYTRGHCDRVAEYAATLAMKIGVPDESIMRIKYGGWLHDCGKIGVPGSVLNFPGKLDEASMKIIYRHPLWGADVARQAGLPEEVINAILSHHEKFDGSGYPYGLQGDEISLEARIVTIADVFDSLRTRRPYRAACSSELVREIMRDMTQSFFDPHLMKQFQSIADEVLEEDAQRAATHHRELVELSHPIMNEMYR